MPTVQIAVTAEPATSIVYLSRRRYLAGTDREAALEKLAELRQVTADGAGADRLAWGDALANAPVGP